MQLNEFNDVLEFALKREREAVEFYQECSHLARNDAMKEAFLEMKEEEKGHVRMLENFNPDQIEEIKIQEIQNLKIADYIVNVKYEPNMSYKEVLELAMKREESAYRLYTDLSARAKDLKMIKLFQVLAQEELKHKNRFEQEYDDMVFQED